jgi:hypothetical protein
MKKIKNTTESYEDKSRKVLNEPFYFIKWIFKAEFIILLICLGFIIIFNLIPDKTKFIIKYNIEKNFVFDVENKECNYELIEEALITNNYIDKSEKDFISNALKNEIEENQNYINIDKIVKRLKKLQVSYNKKYSYIAGSYNSVFNKINIYEKSNTNIDEYEDENFSFSTSNKEVYFHELNHLITNSIQVSNQNIFSETINEMFTREYFNSYMQKDTNNTAYEDYMKYAYVLAEILPEDTIRKFKFSDNESVLVSGLLEIDNNIDEVYELISSIKLVNEDKEEIYKKIHNGYAYFYEKKYNKKMSEDLNMLLYFYDSPIQTTEEKNIVRNFLEMQESDEIINIAPKGYVSEKYKESNKCVQVEYTKNGKKETIEINN